MHENVISAQWREFTQLFHNIFPYFLFTLGAIACRQVSSFSISHWLSLLKKWVREDLMSGRTRVHSAARSLDAKLLN
jgi:hypothetical protein